MVVVLQSAPRPWTRPPSISNLCPWEDLALLPSKSAEGTLVCGGEEKRGQEGHCHHFRVTYLGWAAGTRWF